MKAIRITLKTSVEMEEHTYDQCLRYSSKINGKEPYPNEQIEKVIDLFNEARKEMVRINYDPDEVFSEVGYEASLCMNSDVGSDHKISIMASCTYNDKLNNIFKEIIKIIGIEESPIEDEVLNYKENQ